VSGATLPAGERRAVGRGPALRTAAVAIVLAAAVAASGFAAGRGVVSSLALLTSGASTGGNVLTAGTWVVPTLTWYLHNRPTPPTGNTTAQMGMAMDTTAPTTATLYNYDTNADASAGRSLLVSGSGAGETNTAYATSWLSAPLAAARFMSGTATVSMFSATANFTRNRAGGLVAYLRDYDPGTGTYRELGSGTLNQANWQGGSTTWVARSIPIAIAATTVAIGHRLELKVEASSASSLTMWIAYDTTTRLSLVVVP
jgi:hypothetical protein